MTEKAVRVFISYSHKDEELRDKLDAHLSNLHWDGVISSWYDRQLIAGMEWNDTIKTELESADIILLLISPDFIASRYCREVEIPMALQRHDAKQASVVPIVLRPFDWMSAPFAKLQTFPKDAKPVTIWANQDEAFVSVAQGIRAAAQLIQGYRKQQAEQKQLIRAQYLQKVEEVLSDGVISIVERDTLDELRVTLGLTPEEAKEIEANAYEPFSRYEESLNRYKQTLNRLIEKGYYPFSEELEKDLENRQRDLGLKSEDANRIAKPILEQAELGYQVKQLAEAKRLQEQEQNRRQEAHKAELDRARSASSKTVQTKLSTEHRANDQISQEIDGKTDGKTRRSPDSPKVSPERESPLNPSVNPHAPIVAQKAKPQEWSGKDEIVLNLINQLFDILSHPDIQTSLQNFEAIAHPSLFHNGQIDPTFRKSCFNVATKRLSVYKLPIEIIRSEPTKITRLGSRENKENGKEKKYVLARRDNVRGFEGHIRLFFPANGNPVKVSGFNL
jgi:TIR domain